MNLDDSLSLLPVRNVSVVGAHVYSHSGEFSPQVADLRLPARGVSAHFTRKYRSAHCGQMGPLGRGWTFTYDRTVTKDGNDVLYRDGSGRTHRFQFLAGRGSFQSPDGLYAALDVRKDAVVLRQRFGSTTTFERPERGGRLLAIADRNGNALRFTYGRNAIRISDPFGRGTTIALERNRVVALRDHGGRTWRYAYDADDCLVEVIHPSTEDGRDGARTRYAYDEAFRLASITDPKGQAFLRNSYDARGRVAGQRHGDGTFTFEYLTVGGSGRGSPVYRTHVTMKNGALLKLQHDAGGHVTERTLAVSVASLSPDDGAGPGGDMIPLVTRSTFNRHGEVVARTYPAGNTVTCTYNQDHPDPLARGNLREVRQTPAPGTESDQLELVTRYAFDPAHQQLESWTNARGHTTRFEYDAHGNLAKATRPPVSAPKRGKRASGNRPSRRSAGSETYEYNDAGQLIRCTDARGVRTELYYHPSDRPGGAKGQAGLRSYTQKAGGYLARVVRDAAAAGRRSEGKPARLTEDRRYDTYGNLTAAGDGKGNATLFEYDAHNRVVSVTSRAPFRHRTSFRYDANGNLQESTVSFDHYHYDPVERTVVRRSTKARRRFAHDALNNVVRRTVAADGREVTHTLIRDADGAVVREIDPTGGVIEYAYDERGLMIAKRLGAGTDDQAETRYTYTRNGRLGATVDARGNAVRYDYDGFDRYRGFADAGGTIKRQWFDEAGNVTHLEVRGDLVSVDVDGEVVSSEGAPLLEAWFEYDELNRRVRADRGWRDPVTGRPLGKSRWDGRNGVVSTVTEYGDNDRPSKIWRESGNTVTLQYDGANRPVRASEETGESVSFEYDANSNPVRVERTGPAVNGHGRGFRQTLLCTYDELDRPVTHSLNGGAPRTFTYNALGLVTEYENEAGVSAKILHDGLARPYGRAMTAVVPRAVDGKRPAQVLVQRVEWDDNGRPVARVDAADNRTTYTYDALGWLTGVRYADGMASRIDRDRNGNPVRVVDPNGTIITNRFDRRDRLAERRIEGASAGSSRPDRFHYDGLNRLVAAVTASATTTRRYDTLSRVSEESQSGRLIRYGYDAAGNCVRLLYPGGHEVRKTYDLLRRVTEVRDGRSRVVTAYAYGSGTQVREQRLGGVLNVAFAHVRGEDRLSRVVYRSARTGAIVDGSGYCYDAVGNPVERVRLRRGEGGGDRYFYDSANRLVRAQYGVARLADADSPFEREVVYDLSPGGIWQRKTSRNGSGQTPEVLAGTANRRGAYLSLGSRHFRYDANGNRVSEEGGEAGGPDRKQFSYDAANRLVGATSVGADGRVVQEVEYAYDTFGRQVMKRVSRDGVTKSYALVWHGSQLIEEWEDGELAKTFTYGARTGEPLKVSVQTGGKPEEYFYALDGRGIVTGLIDRRAALVERYRCDAFGLPFRSESAGPPAGRAARTDLGNPLLIVGAQWDHDTQLYIRLSDAFDPSTGASIRGGNPGIPTQQADFLVDMIKEQQREEEKRHNKDLENIGMALVGIGFIVVVGLGLPLLIGGGLIFAGVGVSAYGGFRQDELDGYPGFPGNNPGPVPGGGGKKGGKQYGSSDSSGGGFLGNSGSSGGPEDRPDHPMGGGVDYGHEGGGGGGGGGGGSTGSAGGTGGSQAPAKEHKPTVGPNGDQVWEDTGQALTDDEKRAWADQHPDKKPQGGSSMPNPVDGGGEDVDKDWWRNLPNRDAMTALKPGFSVDEGLVTFSPEAMGGNSYLTGVLVPSPITVDPGGEGITINLAGIHSNGGYAGTSSSDGWGDKPRSLAEALAAPRIRDAATSRF